MAHKHNITVYALLTDSRMVQNIHYYDEIASSNNMERFDGIALNFEDFHYHNESQLLVKEILATQQIANRMDVPIHVSISHVARYEPTFGSAVEKPYIQIINLLKKGRDSIDIQ